MPPPGAGCPSQHNHAIAVSSAWQPARRTICALSAACLYLQAYSFSLISAALRTMDSAPTPLPRKLRPTDVLKHEHRQIEERLQVLSSALKSLGNQGPDAEILDRIEEVAQYIDREMAAHHQKEEEGLFPLLARYLDEDLHLDGRIADHEDLKIMSGKFKQTLEDCRSTDDHFAAQMLRGYGLYIVHLVLEHLLKEDEILFLVADRYLSDEEEAEILRRFSEIDATAS